MSSKMRATRMTNRMKSIGTQSAPRRDRLSSGMLQNDMEDDVADVAAAIEGFFQQFVEIFQDNDADSTVIAVVEIAEHVEHELIGVTLDALQFVVLRFDTLQINTFAQFTDELDDGVGRLFEHRDLACQLHGADMFAGEE